MTNTPREADRDREQILKEASEQFGRRVRDLRKAAGLTQTELAERLSHWGRSYHQTTVAKLENGTRPTTLHELIPLAVALGVSQREFFDEPSPADHAERKVRESEQDLLRIQAELSETQNRFEQLRSELERSVELYSRRVSDLREYNSAAARERASSLEGLEELVRRLHDLSPQDNISSDVAEEARLEEEHLEDLNATYITDRWPG